MIKTTAKTTVTKGEKFTKELVARLGMYKEAYVTVGFHAGAGNYPGGQDVVEVAMWNEFGTNNIPERSFFRSALSEAEGKINSWREEMIENIVLHGWSIEKALEAMGLRIQILIQEKIKSNVPPPYGTGKGNASPEEIERAQAAKARRTGGSIDTLVESGLMLRSVGFQVVVK